MAPGIAGSASEGLNACNKKEYVVKSSNSSEQLEGLEKRGITLVKVIRKKQQEAP